MRQAGIEHWVEETQTNYDSMPQQREEGACESGPVWWASRAVRFLPSVTYSWARESIQPAESQALDAPIAIGLPSLPAFAMVCECELNQAVLCGYQGCKQDGFGNQKILRSQK